MSTTETEVELLRTKLDETEADLDFWQQTALDLFDNSPQSIEEMREFLSEKQVKNLQYTLNKTPRSS